VIAAVAIAAVLYLAGVRRYDADHRAAPLPRVRAASFLAGLAVLLGATVGWLEDRALERFSAHMVQHLLLALVVPPLLLWGRPLLLARRATRGRTRGALLAILRSPVVHVATHPVVTWSLFAVVLWATHYTSLYERAIGDPVVHVLEHGLYLGAGLLFWLPVLAAEPSRWRLGYGARLLYLFLAAPANALLASSLIQADRVLYPAYEIAGTADQRTAAAVMWIGGGLLMLAAVLLVAASWARHERARDAAPSQLARIRDSTAASGPATTALSPEPSASVSSEPGRTGPRPTR
jgi:cytochrome c oxidase assembly factor CtaG